MPQKYLALLRGINVGGHNIIKMTDLKSCFEKNGYQNVSTYIQSGNVIFSTTNQDAERLSDQIQKLLHKSFGLDILVVIISFDQLKQIVVNAPADFGQYPEKYHYDVIFLKKPLTPAVGYQTIPTNPDVDHIYQGKNAIYFSRSIAEVASSKLPRIISLPIYHNMTIRNWNTTTKLLRLFESD